MRTNMTPWTKSDQKWKYQTRQVANIEKMGRKPGSGSLGLGRRRVGAPNMTMACLKTAVTDNL